MYVASLEARYEEWVLVDGTVAYLVEVYSCRPCGRVLLSGAVQNSIQIK